MNHHRTIGSLLVTLALGIAGTLVVQSVRATGIPTPGTLTYTGSLANPDGTPVTAASKNIGITAYDAATAGTIVPECTVASGPVGLTLGQFQIQLPDTCSGKIQATSNLWIDVTVDGGSLGRTKLGAVPYAVEAGHALATDSAAAAANATHAIAADTATHATHAATADSATTATSAQTAATATTIVAGPIAGSLQRFSIPGGSVTASSSPCAIAGGAIVDCKCPTGTYVISGGGDVGQGSGHLIRESQPLDGLTAWRITCANGTTDVACATYSFVCSRIGP